jgi:hypothetical protein
MPTTAHHLPLARAHLRLVEGTARPPERGGAAILAALTAAVMLAAATPLSLAAAMRADTERPAATLPGKIAPAFDDDGDAAGG